MTENIEPNLAAFQAAMKNGTPETHLDQSIAKMEESIAIMKKAIVEGKSVTNWAEYTTHFPIFFALHDRPINEKEFLGTIGLDLETVKQHYVAKRDAGTFSEIELINDLIKQITVTGTAKLQTFLFYDQAEIDRVLKTLPAHDEVNNDLVNQRNQATRRSIILNLYRDAFELYLRALTDLCEKVEGNKNPNNSAVYKFARKHPPIYDIDYHDLRNDVSHLEYAERDKYTDEQLHHLSNLLLVKLFSLFTAKLTYLLKFHKTGVESITDALANPLMSRQ